jgi:hypothetical protein
MCRRMRELILLVVPLMQCDEYTKVVLSCRNFYACAGKFSRELIKAPGRYTLLGTIDIEG